MTTIGSNAFFDCAGLTNVTIPSGVSSVESGAFGRCAGLTELTIPDSVTNLQSSFGFCSNLKRIVLPSRLTEIGGDMFGGCSNLVSVTIPASVTNISGQAFWSCVALPAITVEPANPVYRSIEGVLCTQDEVIRCPPGKAGSFAIPAGISSLGQSAFEGCARLTSLGIPQTVTFISMGVFRGCAGLTTLTIPPNATFYFGGAFQDCSSLVAVQFLNRPTSIAADMFSGCSRLAGLDIPASVTAIGPRAFSGCLSLTNMIIRDGVVSIGGNAFTLCTSLTNVTLGAGVTNLEPSAFTACSNLASIYVSALNPAYRSIDGVLFNNWVTQLIRCPPKKAGPYTIPPPPSGADIAIFEQAFAGCDDLTSISIPAAVSRIYPGTVLGGSKLEAYLVDASNPVLSSLNGVLFDKAGVELLRFPQAKGGTYVVPASVVSIRPSAFADCARLNAVSLPPKLAVVEAQAFEDCAGLTNVTIGASVSTIRAWAFANCPGLAAVTLPASVTNLHSGAFAYDSNLASVFCEGNAPQIAGPPEVFLDAPFVTVFYKPGTVGWQASYSGRPTAVWVSPPPYAEWATTIGLNDQYPNGSGAQDDPDGDQASNAAEQAAGTDPTNSNSVLLLESSPRWQELAESDKLPLDSGEQAFYFRSVPGKRYGLHGAQALEEPWTLLAVRSASTTQTRFAVPKPERTFFYRVVALP